MNEVDTITYNSHMSNMKAASIIVYKQKAACIVKRLL